MSKTQCNSPFPNIHSNIWEPSRVTFGFNYFVIFVDEFSQWTWVYLMKHKSKLLSIFMPFFNEIKNQFGKIIEILSGNSKEYFFCCILFNLIFPRNFTSVNMSSHSTTKWYSREKE